MDDRLHGGETIEKVQIQCEWCRKIATIDYAEIKGKDGRIEWLEISNGWVWTNCEWHCPECAPENTVEYY